jgi:hypothetical protein
MNEYVQAITCGSCGLEMGRDYEWPHFCATEQGVPIIWENPWPPDELLGDQ